MLVRCLLVLQSTGEDLLENAEEDTALAHILQIVQSLIAVVPAQEGASACSIDCVCRVLVGVCRAAPNAAAFTL